MPADHTSTHDLTIEQVRTAVAGLTSPWTVEQLARSVGESPEDVLPYVHRLVAGGSLEELGEDPRHEPGVRAPKIYGPASPSP